jgi:anti-anti-sigma regulatory factor
MRSKTLQIEVATESDHHVARLSGGIDFAASTGLIAALTALEGSTVVADLSSVTSLDDAGLRALFEAKQRIESKGRRRFEVRGAHGDVRMVFTDTGTEFVLADLSDRDQSSSA